MKCLFPVGVACLAGLAGCGGGGDKPQRTVELAAGERVRVVAEEYAFDPTTIVVAGSGALRITLDNQGELAHNITVRDGERELGGVPSFPAGEQRSTTVDLAPGTYSYVCTVADHEELGMTGELRVRD